MDKEREIELLGEYSDEEEEKYVTGVEERFDELIRGLFELQDYIKNTQYMVESERGERELDVIKDSLDTLIMDETMDKENAKIASMFDDIFPEDSDEEFTSDLDFSEDRDYQDEVEKNRVESIDYEWRQLKDNVFNFRKYIEKQIGRVSSERAIEELSNIFEEVKLMTDLQDG